MTAFVSLLTGGGWDIPIVYDLLMHFSSKGYFIEDVKGGHFYESTYRSSSCSYVNF